MGELHLDIKVDILKRTYKVDANVGAPQVAYRETITAKPRSTTRTRSRPAAPASSPASRSSSSRTSRRKGFEFESKIVGGAVPKEYIPGVEKGLESVLASGVLAGFPVVDVKVDADRRRLPRRRLLGARLRDRLARGAARALQKGGSVLLEPIMKVEVVTPEDYVGSVIGDLNSRRGQIQGQDMRGNANVINAMVPLANMFGYVNTLRSMSQGRAPTRCSSTTTSRCRSNVAEEVQAKYA
jgi:elongation factor G